MGCLDEEALVTSASASTFGLILCYSLLGQFPATLESKGVQVSLHRNDVQAHPVLFPDATLTHFAKQTSS